MSKFRQAAPIVTPVDLGAKSIFAVSPRRVTMAAGDAAVSGISATSASRADRLAMVVIVAKM